MRLPSQKKGLYYVTLIVKLRPKTGFSRIKYANSVVIAHFFKIKHQNALSLFASGKLRFPRASKHYFVITCPTGKLLKKLILTPDYKTKKYHVFRISEAKKKLAVKYS